MSVGDSKQRGVRWLSRLAWVYLVLVLSYWVVLRESDDWWPATVLAYAPRWPFAFPLVGLLPCAIRWPRRMLLPVATASLIFVWAILGMMVNIPGLSSRNEAGLPLKVISLNADGNELSVDAFQMLLERENPDIVMIQERTDEMLDPTFWGEGWHVEAGPPDLAVASKFPIRPVSTFGLNSIDGTGGAASYWLDSPKGKVFLVDMHLDTPRGGLEAMMTSGDVEEMRKNIARRELGSGLISGWLVRAKAPTSAIICGDFNLAPDSVIFRRYWGQYNDAFSQTGIGFGFTKHTSWHGLRIDHVLYGDGLSCSECRVGPDVGSDHRPVIAVLRAESPVAK